jgi:UPF0271 protein
LDASAFYAGIPFSSGLKWITSSLVFNEIQHIKRSFKILDALIDTGNLVILQPDDASITTIENAAKQSGDISKLSKADISILALAYQLKRILITDDYRIANVSQSLDVVVKTIGSHGIKGIRQSIAICPACKITYSPQTTECSNCGNTLKYKYKAKLKSRR